MHRSKSMRLTLRCSSHLLPPPPAEKTTARQNQTWQARARDRPGNSCSGRYGAKQPVHLAVNTIGEEEGVGASPVIVNASCPEAEEPKAAWHVVAYIDRNRALEHPGHRIEGVNLAGGKAEIADQQVAAEPTEIGRGDSNAPWGREGNVGAAKDRLQQVAARVENRHRSHPRSSTYLGWTSGRRVGRIHFVADALDVERDEPEIADRGGSRDCVHFREGAVEDIDAPSSSGVQLRLG